MLTIPNATPSKAAWYSKLGVGNSGVGYANANRKDRPAQKVVTETQINPYHQVEKAENWHSTLTCKLSNIAC